MFSVTFVWPTGLGPVYSRGPFFLTPSHLPEPIKTCSELRNLE